jgi:hypothetical protein
MLGVAALNQHWLASANLRSRRKWMKLPIRSTVALAAAAMLSGVPLRQARADIQPAANSPAIAPCTFNSVSGFCWTYEALLNIGEQLQTGDFFTIYDFGGTGTANVVSKPAAFTLSFDPLAPSTATTNVGTIIPTQTNAMNYTFTYSGATITPTGQTGDISLGLFQLFSTSGTAAPNLAAWVGQAHDALHPDQPDGNITPVSVPSTVNPEPATFVLLGTGMVGLAGVVRRRRKASA